MLGGQGMGPFFEEGTSQETVSAMSCQIRLVTRPS